MKKIRLLTDEEREIYHRSVTRGSATKSLVSSEAWKNISLWFDETVKTIQSENLFRPGSDVPSLERIALLNAYNAGRVFTIESLLEQMDIWVVQGSEASEKLVADDKKAKEGAT